jgi:hypothetical protein
MLDKLCLVMDIDETMVHYTENYVKNFTVSDIFNKTASIIHRPGLKEFFDFVKSYSPDNVFKSVSSNAATVSSNAATVSSNAATVSSNAATVSSNAATVSSNAATVSSNSSSATVSNTPVINNKSIVLGIWTYGTKTYANEVAKVLKETYNIDFEFIYSRETMQDNPGIEEKELDFILEKHGSDLDIKKENIYLVDNCPSNVYHHKNIKNSILVTSFVGLKIDEHDKMFFELIGLCKELLNNKNINEKKYINKFTLNGIPTNIISIGRNGKKSWDSDDTCVLHEETSSFFGGLAQVPSRELLVPFRGNANKTIKRHKRFTRKRNNKRRIYKTGRTLGFLDERK